MSALNHPPWRRARRAALRGLLGPALLALTGSACTLVPDWNHDDDGAPRASPWPPEVAARSRFALVLGSGGPRGFVHIGVIKALDDLGVRPDAVVGASIGSLVGALYAGGTPGAELERIAMRGNVTEFVRFAIGARERFSGAAIAQWVNRQVANRPIEQLALPFAAVALCTDDNRVAVFTQGDTGVAVQASCALAGVFAPVKIRGRTYMDPDFVAPVPVRLTRTLGASKVLSVDASAHEDRAPVGAEQFRDTDLAKRAAIVPDARAADLHLHPYFGYWAGMSEAFKRRAIEAGYRETIAQRERIMALI